MVARPGSHSPLSLATRLVQAVDAPDPVGAALSAVSETVGGNPTAFYAFNPADGRIVMTHATIGDALSRDALALHHLEDASIAAQTLRAQSPVILPQYSPSDDVRVALEAIGVMPPYNLVSFPVTVGEYRFGVIQALNVAPRSVGPDAVKTLEEIGMLFGSCLASARRRTELITLERTFARVNQSLDLQETLNAVIRGVMALVPCITSSIYLDGLAPDALVPIALRIESDEERYFAMQPRPLDGSLTGWVYRHRQSVNIPDLFADPRALRIGSDGPSVVTSVHSYLMVPLIVGESPVGVLVASRHGTGAFTDDDLRIVERFAPLAAQAVANARLYITARTELEGKLAQQVADGERRERDAAFVAAVAQACNSASEGPATLQTLADLTAHWADSASVVTFEAGSGRLAAYASRTPVEDAAIRHIIEERATRQPDDIQEARVVADNAARLLDLRTNSLAMPLAQAARARDYHTLASVPIRAVGEIVGVMSVAARAATPPLDTQAVATLELVAEQAGLAIARERLNRQVTAQVATMRRRERDTAYVAAIAQACNSAADGPAILQALADLTADWADDARVITFTDGRQTLTAYATRTPVEDAEIRDLLIRTYAAGVRTMRAVEAARERYEPVIEDLHTLPMTPLLAAFLARDYHSKAFMPIRAEGAVVGVLVAGVRAESPAFDVQSLTTLELVAEQAGLAITKDRLLRQVRAQVEELEDANRHKDDFLASLSHELRTPLNAILGFGRLIADGLIDDPRELHEAADDIVASGELLLAQVNDLLDMARVGAGRMTIGLDAVDLADVSRSCERVLAPLIAAKRQHLTIHIPPQTPLVQADAARLTQVVLNLLTNAHKFTPERGAIRVEVSVRGERVALAVRDTGIGIAPEHVALIFEPFRRVETGYARSQSGTGLGLALSRRLVELMGGTLTHTSAPDRGSIFTVTLMALPIPLLV